MKVILIKKQQGMTLIEMVIMIVVLGILAGVVYVSWPGDVISMNGLAEQIVSDVRYTQTLAMTFRENYRVNFSSDQYSLAKGDGTAVNHPVTGSSIVTMPSSISIATSGLTNSYILFNYKGIPYVDNGTTELASNATVTLSSGGDQVVITIYPETGFATVS